LRFFLLFGPLLLAACTELKTPPPPPPPLELVGQVSAEPLLAIINAAAMDFDRAGAGLAGRPAATALAVARLEWIGGEFQPGRRLARLPESLNFGIQGAVAEARDVLGIRADAPPAAPIAALLAGARALGRGDTAAAQLAMSGPLFLTAGRPMLSRLREPGALPNAALVTAALRDELGRSSAEGLDRLMIVEPQSFGFSTTGLSGAPDR